MIRSIMRSRLSVLLTFTAACLIVPALANAPKLATLTQQESIEWKEFSSLEGRFSVLMPGTPVAKSTERQTGFGKLEFHGFTLALPKTTYSAGYLDYVDYSEDAEFLRKHLDAARDEILARNKNSQLIDERELALGTFTGRELLVLQDQKSFSITEMYIVRGRVYELAIQVPVEIAFANGKATSSQQDRTEDFNSNARRFFTSFEAPEITETMDDFDRAQRQLSRKCSGVLTAVAPGDAAPQNPITSGVLNGRALHLVTPAYPVIARAAHASGQVSVQVIIDIEGNVAAARAVDGHPLLRAAAVKAARESKFTPTMFEGKPVCVNGIIIYNFVAQ